MLKTPTQYVLYTVLWVAIGYLWGYYDRSTVPPKQPTSFHNALLITQSLENDKLTWYWTKRIACKTKGE